MIGSLVTRILATSLALWVADYLLSGFSVSGGIKGYLIAGIVLGLLNSIVRPIVKLVTLPLIWLTLGLFSIIINIAMLWLAAQITGTIVISGLLTLLWTTFIVAVANSMFNGSSNE